MAKTSEVRLWVCSYRTHSKHWPDTPEAGAPLSPVQPFPGQHSNGRNCSCKLTATLESCHLVSRNRRKVKTRAHTQMSPSFSPILHGFLVRANSVCFPPFTYIEIRNFPYVYLERPRAEKPTFWICGHTRYWDAQGPFTLHCPRAPNLKTTTKL